MNNNTCKHCGKEFIKKKNGAKVKYCSDKCYKDYRREYNKIKMREASPPKSDVIIVCEWCGKSHTVPSRTAHQARFCSDDCRYTFRSRETLGHLPIEEHNAMRRKQKLIRQKRLEIERLNRMVTRECNWCGNVFETTDTRQVTCSNQCSRKRTNRIKWERRQARLNEHNTVDKDITLPVLYKRDGGICHICNEPCNYDDKQITSEGHFIAGKSYPSIDHVIPIAKGGKHSWDNVKLAHHRCNALKSDSLIDDDNKALA